MKIALVSTYAYPLALGLRYVSAFLKRAGHDVTLLFMSSPRDTAEADFSPRLLARFVERTQGADVVGMSLMTNTFIRSCVLTEAIRKAGVRGPVVWGGTHPTVAPLESAKVADYVCVGEGEQAMLEFVENLAAARDPGATHNFAYLRHGELVRNPHLPLTDDLDAYPFPDYDAQDHWIVDGDALVPVRPKLLRGALRRYRLSSTRGCPYSCSFCNNATQMNIYRRAGHLAHWVRKRSAENVIAEIEHVRERYPQIEAINLIDDLFLIRSESEIEEFVAAYRSRINLPLELDAFPNTITERKVALLAQLPIELISMGIQSGSADTLHSLYNRPTKVETIARAIDTLSRHGLQAEYHYLVANPFEPEESMVQTLRFVADHHRGPAKIRVFPLQLYPGSELFERARREGVIGERHQEAYRFTYTGKKHIKQAAYLEIWLRIVLALRGAGLPSPLVHRVINFALHPQVRRCIDRPEFAPIAFYLYRVGRVLHKNLIHKPFVQPVTSLRMRWNRRKKRTSAVTRRPTARAA
jgi:anaerobic magnesium-protoporphyrin IX monomethyl ester cyclase